MQILLWRKKTKKQKEALIKNCWEIPEEGKERHTRRAAEAEGDEYLFNPGLYCQGLFLTTVII